MIYFIISFLCFSIIFITIRECYITSKEIKAITERHKRKYFELISDAIIKYAKDNPDSEFSKKIKKYGN